jgi:hypothetical protein
VSGRVFSVRTRLINRLTGEEESDLNLSARQARDFGERHKAEVFALLPPPNPSVLRESVDSSPQIIRQGHRRLPAAYSFLRAVTELFEP